MTSPILTAPVYAHLTEWESLMNRLLAPKLGEERSKSPALKDLGGEDLGNDRSRAVFVHSRILTEGAISEMRLTFYRPCLYCGEPKRPVAASIRTYANPFIKGLVATRT